MARTGVGRYGCLFMLLLVGLVSLEFYLCLLIYEHLYDDLLAVMILVFAVSLVGYWLLRWRLRHMREAMLSGASGRYFAAIAGCVLLVIPGPLTAVCGLLLQIPPIQALCAGLATRVAQAFMRRAIQRMLHEDAAGTGAFGGDLPRGFRRPGGPPPGTPPGAGRQYEVEAEHVDDEGGNGAGS